MIKKNTTKVTIGDIGKDCVLMQDKEGKNKERLGKNGMRKRKTKRGEKKLISDKFINQNQLTVKPS